MASSVPHTVAENSDDVTDPDLLEAVCLIQRVYRGYRTRRELHGRRLTATNHWIDTIRDAQWQHRHRSVVDHPGGQAHRNWQLAVRVAQLAHGDGDVYGSRPSSAQCTETAGKAMDLQYFLEMVDQKHRHGSNLRKYHEYWKMTASDENFFHWLDDGAGKDIDLPSCPRAKLEREQVRYLSRAERFKYLVKIDDRGRFRWAKDNELIWTKNAHFTDSENGIMPLSKRGSADGDALSSTASLHHRSASRDSSLPEECKSEDNTTVSTHRRRNLVRHIQDKIFGGDDWWIFVADPSYRLYIGMKNRGYFQHSSFLRGGRIGAAGLIKIRHGKLRDLSPMSGHYRPPSANFHAFIHALQAQGADISRISITKLYATIAGMEKYAGAKQSIHHARDRMKHRTEKES